MTGTIIDGSTARALALLDAQLVNYTATQQERGRKVSLYLSCVVIGVGGMISASVTAAAGQSTVTDSFSVTVPDYRACFDSALLDSLAKEAEQRSARV